MSQNDSSTRPASSNTATYDSPSMSGMSAGPGQYPAYPPVPEGQGQTESQTGANGSSLNLPPIRGGDGRPVPRQQQQQQPPQPQAQASGQAPPPSMQYYLTQGQQFPTSTSDPSQHLRYAIPPADGRVMSGGRHKKEIKRRTKTGCLTCRKRRIKCDEGHPACRNCQKSKRDCLGYDPIFKPQPGPSPLQPALSAAPHMSANPSSYPPPGYPPGYPAYGLPPTGSENSTSEIYDYNATLDPALGGEMSQGGDATNSADPQGHRAKRTKIENLLCIRGYSPPPPPPLSAIPDTVRSEINHIWATVYAPGIDKFLETKWFASRGQAHLMANTRLCEQFATLIHRYSLNPHDPNWLHTYNVTQSLEATVVWAMMGMCREAVNAGISEDGALHEDDEKEGVHDAAKRLDTFEALVTGEHLVAESAPKLSESKANGTVLEDQLKTREREFWSFVHTFLTIRDEEASAAKEIDDTITSCRGLLDSRENRDVIYSIMIARHLGARMTEFPDNLQQPRSNDEEDAKTKLFVAKDFIESEAAGKGTNQVVQRLCGMAARSWSLKS